MAERKPPDDPASGSTREKILQAAARLFARHGYEGTALAEVAREAHVSKALIFWHFDSKEELFRCALRRNLEPYFIDTGELQGLDEAGQIGQLIESFYQFVNDNLYSVRFFMNLMLRAERRAQGEGSGVAEEDDIRRVNDLYHAFRQSFAEILARGRERGVFSPSLQPEKEAALILVTLAGVLVQQLMLGEPADRARELIDFYKQTLLERLTRGAAH